jgi:hypothetical protein
LLELGGVEPVCHGVGGGTFTAALPVDYAIACNATADGTVRYTDVSSGVAASQPVTWVGPCTSPTTTTLSIPSTVDTGWTAGVNPARVSAGPTVVTSGTVTISVNGAFSCSYTAGTASGCATANLPAGTDQVEASYSGSTIPPYDASSTTETVTVLPAHPSGTENSENWAGYEASGDTFTYVSASWTVPAAQCGILEVSTSSTWVGIDGGTGDSTGPEQIGTDCNCGAFTTPGTSTYWAWWQMNQPGLKGWPHWIGGPGSSSWPVYPGDRMTASVTATGAPGQHTLTIDDESEDWPQPCSVTETNAAATGVTAECIEEQPAALGLPLTNFGSVTFSQCKVAGSNGAATPIWDHPNTADTMTDASGATTKASVSPLSEDGTQFTVTWDHS